MIILWIIIGVIVLSIIILRPRVFREYERAVTFRLGRFQKLKGPGVILVPLWSSIEKVDLRTVTMSVPSQDVISKDNVSTKVNAVVYFHVADPAKAIINVEKYYEAISQLAQTTLRSVLGKHSLDDMLTERDKLNGDVQKILEEQTTQWGLDVANVEIKDVEIDSSILRAMSRQAEAERSRRAKIILAEGESQASENLVKAAKKLGDDPRGIQLRYLQTLSDISQDKAKTIVFPMPMDIVNTITEAFGKGKNDQSDRPKAHSSTK
jgi:regulator of protease activity HflC (stomatin/prohibitin superfamily)